MCVCRQRCRQKCRRRRRGGYRSRLAHRAPLRSTTSLTGGPVTMSDHFSGPRALAGPLCDIADVFAFPSPERSGHLVLVMNILPKATRASSFSDAIICRLRLRCAAIAATGPDAHFDVGHEEIVFDLSFDESDDGNKKVSSIPRPVIPSHFVCMTHTARASQTSGSSPGFARTRSSWTSWPCRRP